MGKIYVLIKAKDEEAAADRLKNDVCISIIITQQNLIMICWFYFSINSINLVPSGN